MLLLLNSWSVAEASMSGDRVLDEFSWQPHKLLDEGLCSAIWPHKYKCHCSSGCREGIRLLRMQAGGCCWFFGWQVLYFWVFPLYQTLAKLYRSKSANLSAWGIAKFTAGMRATYQHRQGPCCCKRGVSLLRAAQRRKLGAWSTSTS